MYRQANICSVIIDSLLFSYIPRSAHWVIDLTISNIYDSHLIQSLNENYCSIIKLQYFNIYNDS